MFRIQIGFTIFLLALFAYSTFKAASFSLGAEIFPLGLGISGLILCVIQLAKEIHARSKTQEAEPASFVDIASEKTVPYDVAFRKAANMLIWIVGLYLAIWVVGFKIAVIAFFLLYLRREGHVKWSTTLVLMGIAFYAIFFHFGYLMSIHWPDCLLSNWVNIPWLWR